MENNIMYALEIENEGFFGYKSYDRAFRKLISTFDEELEHSSGEWSKEEIITALHDAVFNGCIDYIGYIHTIEVED